MEVFLEKSITNKNIDKHVVRNTIFNVLRIASLVWILAGIILFMNVIPPGATPIAIIFDILLMFIPPIFLFLIMSKLLADLNPEYDYHIEGSDIRIVKILNRKRRKVILRAKFNSVVSIGDANSDDYDTQTNSIEKKIIASCNDEITQVYIIFNDDGEKLVVVLEADSELILALKRSIMPVLYANSFKNLLKREAIQ